MDWQSFARPCNQQRSYIRWAGGMVRGQSQGTWAQVYLQSCFIDGHRLRRVPHECWQLVHVKVPALARRAELVEPGYECSWTDLASNVVL
jgi:hypothetical protein